MLSAFALLCNLNITKPYCVHNSNDNAVIYIIQYHKKRRKQLCIIQLKVKKNCYDFLKFNFILSKPFYVIAQFQFFLVCQSNGISLNSAEKIIIVMLVYLYVTVLLLGGLQHDSKLDSSFDLNLPRYIYKTRQKASCLLVTSLEAKVNWLLNMDQVCTNLQQLHIRHHGL